MKCALIFLVKRYLLLEQFDHAVQAESPFLGQVGIGVRGVLRHASHSLHYLHAKGNREKGARALRQDRRAEVYLKRGRR